MGQVRGGGGGVGYSFLTRLIAYPMFKQNKDELSPKFQHSFLRQFHTLR